MKQYPELSEQGNQDALHLIERFKAKLQKCAEETISELYCDLVPHIETDAWMNYREEIRLAMSKQYGECLTNEELWARDFREAIFKEHRAELEKGLIADLTARIKSLEEILELTRRMR